MIILQNFLAHFGIKNKFPTRRRLLRGEGGGVREGEGVWVGEGVGEGEGERVGEGLRGELK